MGTEVMRASRKLDGSDPPDQISRIGSHISRLIYDVRSTTA
ncbi:hypothetical protein STRTUCAR8_02744 [Streptomyces turgidiscabies Car8]|uniref:Uncharacterized protein n=1 Tax=Streptomyces turgidiscabies (strain Car8) TaxID=698760 RepID=L7EY62_STRT8|nr:hypothetical protein STRTUCAR8_02744 [Streptomyces turgidiscabies Car8]